jgi:hypothetical protein
MYIPADSTPSDLLIAAAVALAEAKENLLPRILALPQADLWTADQVSQLLTLALASKPRNSPSSSTMVSIVTSLLSLPGARALQASAKLQFAGQATALGFTELPITQLLGKELASEDLQLLLRNSMAATAWSTVKSLQDGQDAMRRLIDGTDVAAAAAAQDLTPSAIQQLAETAISMQLGNVVPYLLQLPAAAAIRPEALGKLLLEAAKAGLEWAVFYGLNEEFPEAVLTVTVLQQLLELLAAREWLKDSCGCPGDDVEDSSDDEEDEEEAEVLKCWGCKMFKELADSAAAELLPLKDKINFVKAAGYHQKAMTNVAELLQQEQYSKEDLVEILKGFTSHAPQAMHRSLHDILEEQPAIQQIQRCQLQELLHLAIAKENSRMLKVLLTLPAAWALRPDHVKQLLRSCWEVNSCDLISIIAKSKLPALKELDHAAVATLVVDAGNHSAACAKALLQLLPQDATVRRRSVHKMLSVVITCPCDDELQGYSWFAARAYSEEWVCRVCQLVSVAAHKAMGQVLAAAVKSGDGRLHHRAALFDRCLERKWTEEEVVDLLLAAVSVPSKSIAASTAAAAAAGASATQGRVGAGSSAGAAAAGLGAEAAGVSTEASSSRYVKVQQVVEMLHGCSVLTEPSKEAIFREAVESSVCDGGAALSALITSSCSKFILVGAAGAMKLIEQALELRSMVALSWLLQVPAAKELGNHTVLQLMDKAVKYGAEEGIIPLLQLPNTNPSIRAAAVEKLQEFMLEI